MIDARAATGVPCITTCPAVVPRDFLIVAGIELQEWQERLLRSQGFVFTERDI